MDVSFSGMLWFTYYCYLFKCRVVLVAGGLVNHKMTKALEGVEVGIRMRCVNKLGHFSRRHLNIFLSHHFVLLYLLPSLFRRM